jgi:tetratricopeptide (TPR) repeat protein
MKEQVYVSGQLGRALFGEGGKYYVADAKHPERPVECRPPDLSAFFRYGAEFTTLPNAHPDRVAVALRFQTSAQRALSLILSGLDEEIENDTRSLAIEASEELLRQEPVFHFVRARLLARPVPPTADMEGARLLAEYTHSTIVESLYRDMRDARNTIPVLLESWHEVALGLFASHDEEAAAEKLLIEAGVFADATHAVSHGDANRLNNSIVTHGLNSELKERLPQVTHILNALRSTLVEKKAFKTEQVASAGREEMTATRPQKKRRGARVIGELRNAFRRGREEKRSKKFRATEAKEKVDNQIEAIEEQIRRGNLDRAERYLQDLIEFQVAHSEREHLAMSLCSLAKAAMDSHALDLAERMLDYAFNAGLNDAVIWRTKAELLKTMGRLSNALTTYDDAARLFFNDVITRRGRAEVLKEMGRLDDALAAYDGAVALFYEDAVTRSGRAEVLKEMGRLNEALIAYEEIAQGFPNDAFARTGRAEVLKEMGRLDEALLAYKEIARLFPNNRIARSGQASLLMLLDSPHEVRTLLARDQLVSRDDWIDLHIIAMSYLKTGEIDEAIKRLAYGLENAPWATVKMYFASALGLARIRKRQFAEAEAVLKSNVVSLDDFQRQKRLALLGHSLAGQGKRDEAAATLASIGPTTNSRLQTLREDVILRFNLPPKTDAVISSEEASALDERIDEEEFYLAMAA